MELRSYRLKVFVSITLAALFYFVMARLESTMQTHGHGILDLEFAWTQTRFDSILADWGGVGIEAAQRQILVDFAFIASYASLLWFLSILARRPTLRWLAAAAAACDVVENLCMLAGVYGVTTSLAPLASVLATIKFTLLLVLVLWLLVRFASLAMNRQRSA